jgi:hypothetical protein
MNERLPPLSEAELWAGYARSRPCQEADELADRTPCERVRIQGAWWCPVHLVAFEDDCPGGRERE